MTKDKPKLTVWQLILGGAFGTMYTLFADRTEAAIYWMLMCILLALVRIVYLLEKDKP